MANFDEFKQRTSETAEYIAAKSIELAKMAAGKTKLLAKISRLKAEIITEKDSVRRAYLELGKLYYMNFRDEAAPTLEPACEKITASLAAIMIRKVEIEKCKADLRSSEQIKDDDEYPEVEPAAEEKECCCGECEAETEDSVGGE